jgi:hypothetical protein
LCGKVKKKCDEPLTNTELVLLSRARRSRQGIEGRIRGIDSMEAEGLACFDQDNQSKRHRVTSSRFKNQQILPNLSVTSISSKIKRRVFPGHQYLIVSS